MNQAKRHKSILWFSVVAILAVAASPGAWGASVEPELWPGNPQCEDVGCGGTQLYIDPPTSGTYIIDARRSITIISEDGVYLNWIATVGVDVNCVIVKGGANANVYRYPDGTLSDTGLHAPLNPNGKPAGLSHVIFCYDSIQLAGDLAIVKEVSVDGGETWNDANDPPGPEVADPCADVYFKIWFKNVGTDALTGIELTDTLYSLATCPDLPDPLAPGQEYTCVIGPFDALPDLQTNWATVKGYTADNALVEASDSANYTGTEAKPEIELYKRVSVDGVNWVDADSENDQLYICEGQIYFKWLVINTGNVTLTNVVVTDNGNQVCSTASLSPSQSISCEIGPLDVKPGKGSNTANVIGYPECGAAESVTDEDSAYYFGVRASIDVEKYVNDDDADLPPGPTILVGDPVTFKFVVTNTGNVDLTDVYVTDSVLGNIAGPIKLKVDESVTFNKSGTAEVGTHTNTATATGTSVCGEVSDEDPANYTGVECLPSIDIDKKINGEDALDCVLVDMPLEFTFLVTNTGTVDLTDVVVTDDVLGYIGTIDSLE
ncbi:MAG TPA: hypothetical protein PLX83_21190, partial [bacterium]|nr:hypothetical protein [bacterium]